MYNLTLQLRTHLSSVEPHGSQDSRRCKDRNGKRIRKTNVVLC